MTLEWAEMVTPSVRHLAFRHESGAFSFTPGQFVTIHFEHDGQTLRRSYSIASVPGKSDLIEFAAGHFAGGPGTEYLFGLQPGDTITTSGPFGRLVLREEDPKRYIFMATSTGVTPFRSMLPQLHQHLTQRDMNVVLLLGVQHRKDLLYPDEFLAFAEEHPNFEFHAHYSREPEDLDLKPFEHHGYVQTAFSSLQLNPSEDVVYLCGNPSMVDDAFSQLQEQGFSTQDIRREKYISSK
jgi:ferredoxin-NADP reductase